MLYHCLLIGLQDLALDTKQKLSKEQLEATIREGLSDKDLKLFEQLLCTAENDEQALAMYEAGQKSSNRFIREWFRYNFLLNNVLTAVICRKHKFDVKKAVLGEGELQDALRSSQQKDFGLSASFDEIEPILRLAEVEDLYEREKKMDALRWEWLEEHTLFSYFEAENVFAYWLQAQMLYRWDILNKEEGTRIFKALVADMKKDVKF